jgi:hypothetical protein
MKALLISLILVLAFNSYAFDLGIVKGDFSGFFDEVWKDMQNSYSESDGREYLDEMGRYHYESPGYSYRVPNMTLQPFSARGPSIKAGCTGISIDMGAFDYVKDPERYVQFLKQVIAGIPGYSFNLALQTFCPQCSELLNKINSLANMVNGLQMDSCGVLEASSSLASGILKEHVGLKASDGGENSFNSIVGSAVDSLDSFETSASELINGILCAAGSGTDCPIKWLDPKYVKAHGNATLLSSMLYRNTNLKTMELVEEDEATEFENLMRAFIGDIALQTSDGDESTPVPVPLRATLTDYRDYVDAISSWIGESWKTDTTVMVVDRKGDEKKFTINDKTSLKGTTGGLLDRIAASYENRNPIDNASLGFLQTFQAPVYKILNNSSIEKHLFYQYIDMFKELAARQLAYEIFLSLNKQSKALLRDAEKTIIASESLAKNSVMSNQLITMYDNINNLTFTSYEYYISGYKEFNEKLANLNTQQDFHIRIQAQMARHPLYGHYLLGKGLAFGQ